MLDLAPPRTRAFLRAGKKDAAAVAFFVLVTLIVTYPLPLHLGSKIATGPDRTHRVLAGGLLVRYPCLSPDVIAGVDAILGGLAGRTVLDLPHNLAVRVRLDDVKGPTAGFLR